MQTQTPEPHEMMSRRDAFIGARVLCRIQQQIDREKDWNTSLALCRILGALQFHIFGMCHYDVDGTI